MFGPTVDSFNEFTNELAQISEQLAKAESPLELADAHIEAAREAIGEVKQVKLDVKLDGLTAEDTEDYLENVDRIICDELTDLEDDREAAQRKAAREQGRAYSASAVDPRKRPEPEGGRAEWTPTVGDCRHCGGQHLNNECMRLKINGGDLEGGRGSAPLTTTTTKKDSGSRAPAPARALMAASIVGHGRHAALRGSARGHHGQLLQLLGRPAASLVRRVRHAAGATGQADEGGASLVHGHDGRVLAAIDESDGELDAENASDESSDAPGTQDDDAQSAAEQALQGRLEHEALAAEAAAKTLQERIERDAAAAAAAAAPAAAAAAAAAEQALQGRLEREAADAVAARQAQAQAAIVEAASPSAAGESTRQAVRRDARRSHCDQGAARQVPGGRRRVRGSAHAGVPHWHAGQLMLGSAPRAAPVGLATGRLPSARRPVAHRARAPRLAGHRRLCPQVAR